ncbi:LysR family transcriptional regulator [Azohydromonas caseinilytica]|uniref:LysR family transcriptional regulator n=1 Tax=Azohydromonas caseinilytica TaxID=2728836 RepID=A0A848FEG3_9BURK|nr:LysR family transcriptional regulator [Azohydromonas caseinilytica]NML16540.1 LysR family transcriptional regulator [Azohydromonas caseinilytica]
MELEEIDLNLLVVFRQLLAERRVSKVAENLGLSQPAVSNALARLRRLLGDELFTRTPQGMAPTPYAEQLAQPLTQALGLIHGALNQKSGFDPATARRAFTVGMSDIGEIWFLPRLVDALVRAAPGVSVSTVRNASVNLKDEMEAAKVDLAIGLLPQLRAGFFQRRVLLTRYVCLMRRGHPLDKPGLTLQEFCAAEHVVVVAQGTGHGRVDEALQRGGVQRRVRLTVPHFTAVGHILQTTALLATVPEPLAQRIAGPFGLAYVPPPVELPAVSINLFWHARVHQDPANVWLRQLILALFAG